MERRADEAERELLQWKKVRFMADKVGDEYAGFITGVVPFGLFIELSEHYVEGLVHISSMADDYYRFLEQQHILKGGEHEEGVPAWRQGPRPGGQEWTWSGDRSIWGLPTSSSACGGTSVARAASKRGRAKEVIDGSEVWRTAEGATPGPARATGEEGPRIGPRPSP